MSVMNSDKRINLKSIIENKNNTEIRALKKVCLYAHCV